MDFDTGKKILKLCGKISMVLGAIYIVLFILTVLESTVLELSQIGFIEADTAAESESVKFISGILACIIGSVSLMGGLLAQRAAEDLSAVKLSWIFSIIGTVTALIVGIATIVLNNGGSIISAVGVLAVNIAIFVITNDFRKY